MMPSQRTRVTQQVLLDFMRELFFLPLWWYSIGFLRVASWCIDSVKSTTESSGIVIWIKNWFVPMYGEVGFSGKLISFGMRSVIIALKGIMIAVWGTLTLFFFIAYLLLFPIAFLGTLYSLFGLFLT